MLELERKEKQRAVPWQTTAVPLEENERSCREFEEELAASV